MPEKTVQKEPGKKPAPSKKPKPQQEVVVQIPLSELHPFPDHPFQVREDASMQETAESVKEYGVLVPALARPREDGGYELIAGQAFTPNLLKGKVFCAHCGGSLHRQRNIRKKSDDVYFYHCLSQSRISKDACPGVTIREDALLDMLADMLQDALDTALGQYTLSLAELPRQAADRAELREKITSRKQEIQRLRGIVRRLYENLVQGVLTKDEYFDYKEKYESRIADLAVEMEQLEDGLRTMDAQAEQHRALEQDAAQIKTDRALTGALIERLIDRIEVSHDKQITVRYRFQSEFETYAEVLEQCRNM